MKDYRVLSLGAGIQSSTVLLMSCRGELPKLDAAIFADTQWEPPAVYRVLEWLTAEAARAGIPVHRVTNGNLRRDTVENFVRGSEGGKESRYAAMPLRVVGPGGSHGMIKRQCTSEYKILPIERHIKREILGLKPRQRVPKDVHVDQWFGISSDEIDRMRVSRDRWRTLVYPLCGYPGPMLPSRMNRQQCIAWLNKNYPGQEFARSACIGCPFHSDSEWRAIKSDLELWKDAVEVDEAIRNPAGLRGQAFLHMSGVPLKDVDLRTSEELGQMEFGFRQECTGYCGM